MAITLNTIKCPECGAKLSVEEGREKLFCSFCGAQIIITNENEHIIHHIDDAEIKQAEAELKQAETDQIVKMKQLELEEKESNDRARIKRIKVIVSLVLGFIGGISLLIGYGNDSDGFLMVGMVSLTAILYIWIMNDDGKKSSVHVSDGTIKIPSGIDDYDDKNYKAIETKLKSAGFTNIQCVPLGDLRAGIFKKPNIVESITIDGTNIDDIRDERFYPNVIIVISYHSFQ